MFKSGPNYTKLKTNLRLAINRLKLLEKKKSELSLQQRKEIADYIQSGKVERAKIRVEHIIREDYLVEAMEILEMYADLLLARFGLIQQMKTLDDGLAEAISSIIWVTPRLQSDVQELKIVSDQLAVKYGRPYAQACLANEVGTVSEKLMHKMSVQAPPKVTVEKYLIEIAKYYNVEYQPDTQILNGDEVYAADHLIDLGPAPPLPGKDDLFTGHGGHSGGGGGGGGAAAPAPFQYPAQNTNPAGAAAFQYPPAGPAGVVPTYPPIDGAVGGSVSSAGGIYPPPPAGGAMSAAAAAKDLEASGFDDGPPPYFPPDINSPASAKPSDVGAASAPLNAPAPAAGPPAGAASLPVVPGSGSGGVPELPEIPNDIPSREDTPPGGGGEEDIDFDDLTARFEALKKKK